MLVLAPEMRLVEELPDYSGKSMVDCKSERGILRVCVVLFCSCTFNLSVTGLYCFFSLALLFSLPCISGSAILAFVVWTITHLSRMATNCVAIKLILKTSH